MRARLIGIAIAVAAGPASHPHAEPACPDGMVRVPRGTFAMGSPDGTGDDDEHPRHQVTISAFCIDRTEVTVKAYEACVAANRCTAPHREISPYCNQPDRAQHPVNCVDWNQAVAYCRWLARRLPTEAEWEYAARGSDGRLYPWGNEPPSATRLNACGRECVAWGKRVLGRDWPALYDGDDGWVTTAPVGSFPAGASPFGALDMAGNLEEWTATWYVEHLASGARPTSGASHVLRGGGWLSRPIDARTTARNWGSSLEAGPNVGFRCARD